jgi:hypothetical protein
MSLKVFTLINFVLIISANNLNIEYKRFNELTNQTDKAVLDLKDQYVELKELSNSIYNFTAQEEDTIKKMKNMAAKYETNSFEIVKFNIGGTYFSTLKSTVQRKIRKRNSLEYYAPNLLQSLINGSIKAVYDEKRAIFIDRNPTYFNHILDYLRSFKSKIIFNPKSLYTGEALDEFIEEAEFYQLTSLIDLIKSTEPDQEIISDDEDEESTTEIIADEVIEETTLQTISDNEGETSTDTLNENQSTEHHFY